MKGAAATLYVLAGVLLLGALLIAGVRVVREHRRLATALDKIDKIIHDDSIPDRDKTALSAEVLEPRGMTWGRVGYTLEWIELLILRDAVNDLRRPAVLTALGVILGTAASVLSLWA